MKVMRINFSLDQQAMLMENPIPRFEGLTFHLKRSNTPALVRHDCHFCSNPLCTNVEQKVAEYNKCGKCVFRRYCARQCKIYIYIYIQERYRFVHHFDMHPYIIF